MGKKCPIYAANKQFLFFHCSLVTIAKYPPGYWHIIHTTPRSQNFWVHDVWFSQRSKMFVSWRVFVKRWILKGFLFMLEYHTCHLWNIQGVPPNPAINVVICNPYKWRFEFCKWGYNPTSKGVMIPPITGSGAHLESIHPEKPGKTAPPPLRSSKSRLGGFPIAPSGQVRLAGTETPFTNLP